MPIGTCLRQSGVRGLGCFVVAVTLVGCGRAGDRHAVAPPAAEGKTPPAATPSPTRLPGRWAELPPERQSVQLTEAQRKEMARLEALGYAAGSKPAPKRSGVTIYDRKLAYAGPNLYTSGHAETALLIDMEGHVLHQWSAAFDEVFPQLHARTAEEQEITNRRERWRRAYLFPNGDLLALYEGIGLIKLDKDSHLLWSRANKSHHDLWVAPDGRIFVLTREAKLLPRLDPQRPVLEDFISILSPDGDELQRISLIKAFENSSYAGLLDGITRHGDMFHTNTLEIFDGSQAGRSPLFRAGNALVSMRTIDLIAIVDLKAKKVVWAERGDWKQQHEPTLLANGHLLLFDNMAGNDRSKVIEFDPLTGKVFWTYEGTPEHPFYSPTCGSNQRLPNGDTLITESDYGRAFEVTPAGRIVWEFRNPARAGAHDELIATVFEMVRLSPEFPLGWAQHAEARR